MAFMVLIATHENTDFDGIAALVAAARLFPAAVAIAPRRMNRNVADFFLLYQDRLPLRLPDDLPSEPVDKLILVDTQTEPQLPGLRPRPPLLIIDHHPVQEPLPNAQYELDTTGAITTVLVERLAEARVALDPVEATLFMLGIYEDTGNLSYEGTTPRDLRAAAYLLEKGASLRILGEFLSYPLTAQQRSLYEQLLQGITTLEVQGVRIALCSAAVDQYVEEVSVVAHRLRELLEPDALFVLVQMGDHIQLVARSTSDTLDVGQVAAWFGGGGHRLAAAALIRGKALGQVREELLSRLRDAVKPAVTVRQIMSHGVHVLAPDTRVEQAAALMQRYGHEGFPVVDGERLIGIITRREIDRAMHHGLSRAPVRAYVRAEGVSVSPSTSVRELQRLMTEHNVGQVPVVEDGKVTGIVTRTDLLKLWAAQAEGERPLNVARKLQEALPEPLWQLLKQIAALADELGLGLYSVGGFVRDLLLGQRNLDLDLVVEGDAIRLARALADKFGGEVRSHRRFGTAKWVVSALWPPEEGEPDLPSHIDFATARVEFYERPTALPVVERSSIKQDLQRRDFTINTLAVCLNAERFGEVLDYFGGLRDLQLGLIRVLHSLSFVEDPTRILRAARLEARLGFRLETRTEALMRDAVDLLRRTTGERVAHELFLILSESEPEKALARLNEIGALPYVAPGLAFSDTIGTAMVAARERARNWSRPSADLLPGAYLCLLFWQAEPEQIAEASARLRLRRELARAVAQIPQARQVLPSLGGNLAPSEVDAALSPFADAVLLCAWAVSEPELRTVIDQYESHWRHVRPSLRGDYLRRLGLRPGPLYARVLHSLRAAMLDGRVSSAQEEEEFVRQWLETVRGAAPGAAERQSPCA